jgi:predicted negative regulator of RcsB-dependent stress response
MNIKELITAIGNTSLRNALAVLVLVGVLGVAVNVGYDAYEEHQKQEILRERRAVSEERDALIKAIAGEVELDESIARRIEQLNSDTKGL